MHSENNRGDPPGVDQDFDEDLSPQERQAIHHWQTMANVWHDEIVPAWQPPVIQTARPLLQFHTWFPTLASATALALALIMFLQPAPATTDARGQSFASDFGDLPQLPKATQAAMVETVLESSRDERKQELQAALAILKAHMDKRSDETEQSLQYVIAHQLQGQQELEELYEEVKELMDGPAPAEESR